MQVLSFLKNVRRGCKTKDNNKTNSTYAGYFYCYIFLKEQGFSRSEKAPPPKVRKWRAVLSRDA